MPREQTRGVRHRWHQAGLAAGGERTRPNCRDLTHLETTTFVEGNILTPLDRAVLLGGGESRLKVPKYVFRNPFEVSIPHASRVQFTCRRPSPTVCVSPLYPGLNISASLDRGWMSHIPSQWGRAIPPSPTPNYLFEHSPNCHLLLLLMPRDLHALIREGFIQTTTKMMHHPAESISHHRPSANLAIAAVRRLHATCPLTPNKTGRCSTSSPPAVKVVASTGVPVVQTVRRYLRAALG